MSWLASMDQASSYQEADSTRKLASERTFHKETIVRGLGGYTKDRKNLDQDQQPIPLSYQATEDIRQQGA